jgi:hypothetical protein
MTMAEVRCPMCGKPNPADLEVCQFCQARLKPLHVTPSESGPEAPSEPSKEGPDGDASAPEWLRSLRLEDEIGDLEEEPQEGDESPDWLSGAQIENPSDLPIDQTAELPDWLTNLRQEENEPIKEAGPQDAEPEEAESSWGEFNAQMPDWLSSIHNEEEPGSVVETSEKPEPEQADEEPDWLQRIRSRSQEEAESSESKEQEVADQPGAWSTAMLQDEEADAGHAESTPAAVEPGEIPDWLSELSEEHETEPLSSAQEWPTEEEPSATETPTEADSPAQPPSAAPFDTGTLRALYSEEGEAEVPSWMARFSGETEPASKAAEGETQAQPAEMSASSDDLDTQELHEPVDEEDGPELDWLTDIQQAALNEQPEEEKPLLFTSSGAISPFTLEEGDESEEEQPIPDTAEGPDASPEGVSTAAPAEIPDWLEEVAPRESGVGLPEETVEQAEPGYTSSQEEIAPAELPSWLEAMRPVEFAASKPPPIEEGADRVESVGPLAGLRGVLPAEPDVSRLGKPTGYSIKLQVSDAQQAHANLLEALVKDEGVARPLPQRSVITSQHLLRLAITIILIVTVVFPTLMGWPQESPPEFPPEAGAVEFYINNLKPGAPVLVAVDYEPGWSGEMDATAAGVIQHLKLMGAYPAFISTVPTGPAQAEHLLAIVGQASGAAWQMGQNYANLGFVPGGAAGLLSFAQSPQKIQPAYSDTGRSAWDEGSLVNVKSVSDFSLAIVITQNPDTARTWIEQVGPFLGENTPLLMLLSAQAEPLVRPYYEEFQQQVKGMVIGLVGGASYENLNGQQLLALKYWNAFNLAIVVAVVIIFVGALFNASLAAAGKRKNNARREGAQ